MTAKIQVRRDTTANWTAPTPPILAAGEFGLDLTLKQIKIGDGSSNWSALPWLGGTLPYFASPTSDNIDDATNRVLGVYRFSTITGLTGTLPPSPIDIVVADGGINMLVIPFGPVVLQHLWTDGDGTQPQKSYTRIYDGAWRGWTPQNLWGVSATEGVDAKVRDIEVQRNATVKGNLSIQGTTNIGDSAGDVGVFQQGAVGTPSQTFASDTDTGAYSPAANEYGIATGGVQRFHVTDALTRVRNAFRIDGNFQLDGALANAFNCGSQFLTNLANPNTPAGALNWQTLLTHVAFVGPITGNGNPTASNGVNWTVTNFATNPTITPPAGNWDGLVLSFDAGGNAESARSRTQNNVTAFSPASSGSNWIIVIAVRRS